MAEALVAQLRADMAQFRQDMQQGIQAAKGFGQGVSDAMQETNRYLLDISNNLHSLSETFRQTSRDSIRSFDNLQAATEDVSKSISDLGNKSNRTLDQLQQSARRTDAVFSDMRRTLATIGTVIATIGITKFIREFVELGTDLISVDRTLRGATGSVQAAGEAFNFVREQSRRLGTDLISGARQFAQMANNVRGTRLEGEGLKEIFTGLSETTAALGLSNDQYRRALIAMNQVLARGRVATEEINQFAEAGIPLYKEFATSLGITGDQLRKLLEEGKVPAEALLLVFGDLRERFKDVATEASTSTPVAFRSLAGVTDELRGKLGQAILNSSVLAGAIIDLRDQMILLVGSLDVQTITKFVDQIIRFGQAVRNIGLREFRESVQQVASVLRLIPGIGNKIPDTLKDIGSGIANIVQYDQKVQDLSHTFEDFEDGFTGVGTTIEKTSDAASERLEKLREEIKRILKEIIGARLLEEQLKQDEKSAKKRIEIFKDYLKQREKDEQELQDRVNAIRERAAKEELDALDAQSEDIINIIRDRLEKRDKLEQQASNKAFQRIVDRTDKLIKEEEDAAKETERIFEHLSNNLQDIFSDTISSALRGDLDNIQDFFKTIENLAADTAAQILTAVFISPALDKAAKEFQQIASGELSFSQASPQTQAIGFAGVLAGAGLVGSNIARAGGSDLAANVIGGVGSGAATGAIAGSFFGPPGVAVGAIVGGVVGGLTAALPSILGGGIKASRIAAQTTPGLPSVRPSDNAFAQGPFGIVSLIDAQSKRTNAQQISNAIAELDRTIFNMVTERQRQFIEKGLQIPPNDTIIGAAAADTDNALAQVFAQRLKIMVSAAADVTQANGANVAQRVVGDVSGLESTDLAAIQKRVEDALNILRQIEEFREGPGTEASNAIKAINQEFDILVSRAEEFGIATAEIEAERQRRIEEVANIVNTNVTQRLADLQGAAQGAAVALKERQRLEYENARDAGANLINLERLHMAEREAIFRDFIDASKSLNLSPIQQQIKALTDEFMNLKAAAIELGHGTEDLQAAFERSLANIRDSINRDIRQRTLDLVNPETGASQALAERQRQERIDAAAAGADLAALDRLHALERKKLAEELAEQARRDAEARRREAEQVAEANRRAAEEERRLREERLQAIRQIRDSMSEFIAQSHGLSASQSQIRQLTRQFTDLRNEARSLGQSTSQLEAAFRRRVKQINEEARLQNLLSIARGEGPSNTRSQISQTINEFVKAGSNIGQFRQQLIDLRGTYKDLIYVAKQLGRSTADITASYQRQVNEIRRVAMERARDALVQFASPFEQAMNQVKKQTEELYDLFRQDLIPWTLVDQFKRLAEGSAKVNEALRVAGGGASSPLEQLADTFEDFVRAGSPFSQFGQEMFNLTENFVNLVDAAKLLGLSTYDLEQSYKAQSQVIRERLIEDIEQQLESQIQGIKSIDEFLASLRIAPEQPGGLRLSAAQAQFQTALQGGNAQDILGAANTLRDIARGQYGSAAGFFAIENQIEDALTAFRDQQQQAVEDERQRMLDQAAREEKQVMLQEASVDLLKRLYRDTSNTSRGIDELIMLARQQNQNDRQTQALLERINATTVTGR